MSAQKFVQAFGAGQVVRFPAGRYFYINSATSDLNVVTEGNPGSPVRFDGIAAGAKFGPVEPGQGWRFLVVESPGAQNVEITISDDGNFEVAANVTVAGVVSTTEQPASTTTNTVPVDAGTGAETALIAANVARRGVWITRDSSNADGGTTATHGGLIRAQTGGNAIDELQPGVSKYFPVTHGLWVRNDSGATNRFYVREEIP
jgi:hypothetical protein